jgi:CMP-N,N'-diacetyllegionaminic acid synthase
VEKKNKKIKCLGLIPARAGSKRVPNKNIKILAGHPLLTYTIRSAMLSGVFSRIIVSTESEETKKIALKYGAEVPFMRPEEFAQDNSPDIEWVKYTLTKLKEQGDDAECFSILRPTSPFRTLETYKKAWDLFLKNKECDSLRAIEKCSQHPYKMWLVKGSRMKPLFVNPNKKSIPWHSMSYQLLPEIYVQNASLEIAWQKTPLFKGTIAGDKILPFITEGYEGFDINFLEDWIMAEYLIKNKLVKNFF